MIRTLLLVGLGGSIGSMLRYLTTVFVSKYYNAAFPLATFIINMIGCLLIGAFMVIIEKQAGFTDNYKLLFVTGFCGGYTTFSAFAYENTSLIGSQNTLTAFIYIAASILSGLLCVWAGMFLGRLL